MNSGLGISQAENRRIGGAVRWCVLFAALALLARSAAGAAALEEVIEQKHAIDAGATLSIQNTDGSITVRGGDVAEISIRAIKKAYTLDRLKSIIVDVKVTPNGTAIETIVPPGRGGLRLEDRSGIVDYVITVPKTMRITRLDLNDGEVLVEGLRGGSVTAHVANGWLVARNCFDDMDLNIMNGRLQVAYDWWEDTKFLVKLANPEGDIRANIPDDASVSIVARTMTGRIVNGLATKEGGTGEPLRLLNATIGSKPGPAFEMNSISGDIRINKSH